MYLCNSPMESCQHWAKYADLRRSVQHSIFLFFFFRGQRPPGKKNPEVKNRLMLMQYFRPKPSCYAVNDSLEAVLLLASS